MELTGEIGRGVWLLERVGSWGRVGGSAGTGFEAYARILHPVDARRVVSPDADEPGERTAIDAARWTWAEVAARNGRVMHPLVQWCRLTDDETALSFADGWQVSPSVEGMLEPDQLAALTEHLRLSTAAADDVTAGVWNGWGELHGNGAVYVFVDADADPVERATERARAEAERRDSVCADVRRAAVSGPFLEWPGRDFLLFGTSLTELADLRRVSAGECDPGWGIGGVLPQLLWPADRSWVVASEIDWDSTIVAGSRTLVEEILADPRFEAYEVDEDSDLTWDGDTLNAETSARRPDL
ncbi:hypothetical protein ACPYO6_13360 [Georgenia sp. Z1344]|uniref:hypothetical protein n=1 Tax=Georgenia sp. Z1344 TaxID=3416706 RepID=UPI003CEC51D4